MRGGKIQTTIPGCACKTDAVERAKEQHAEACEQRLAKIQNTPKAKLNTPWPDQKPGEIKK